MQAFGLLPPFMSTFGTSMKKVIFALLCIANLAGASASASVILNTSGMQYASPTTVHIKSVTNTLDLHVYSGAFNTTASDRVGAFPSWCVDIVQDTFFNETVTDYARVSGVDPIGGGKSQLLLRLATDSLDLVTDARTSSAFQLAIWEILNEPTAAYNLTSGNFTAYGASDDSILLANNWLNNLPAAGMPNQYMISVYESASRQDLATFARVPEPSTIAVLAAGLLSFAVSRRIRKHNA